MTLMHAEIARLVPHSGSMCLLHEVTAEDELSISCRAVSHRDPSHPLRENGVLPSVAGIEYAAQAMAVHGALRAQQGPRPGMLAAVRDVLLRVERLDDIGDDLLVRAERLYADGRHLLYGFELRAGARLLLRGRAVVALAGEDGAQ